MKDEKPDVLFQSRGLTLGARTSRPHPWQPGLPSDIPGDYAHDQHPRLRFTDLRGPAVSVMGSTSFSINAWCDSGDIVS